MSRLPIDELKIDRSIVQAAAHRERDLAILRSVVALGTELGMHPVAEGIEDARTVDLVLAIGCSRGQGFHLVDRSGPLR